jgi:hypothetical protein
MIVVCTVRPAEIRMRRAETVAASATTMTRPSAATRVMGCQSARSEASAAMAITHVSNAVAGTTMPTVLRRRVTAALDPGAIFDRAVIGAASVAWRWPRDKSDCGGFPSIALPHRHGDA